MAPRRCCSRRRRRRAARRSGGVEARLQCSAEGWSKRKRSRRHRDRVAQPSTEEEHLALSLLMLARGHRDPTGSGAAPAQEQHRCSVCGRVFSSYQALGGHKARHLPRTPTPTTVSPDVSSSNSGSGGGGGGNKMHECSVCEKTFPTGHKRCHYEGPIGSSAANAAAVAGRGFDLNLPAVALADIMTELCLPAAAEEEEVLSPLDFKKPRLMVPD